MNTRLQVEHPVTEAITGLDLVEWQFRIAAGEKLPLTQPQVKLEGHAVEARLYAEDPERGFLPSTGRLLVLQFPTVEGIRIDSGVEAGSDVTPFYDPMIAKLIAHDRTRGQALDRLACALEQTIVIGPRSNASFLAALCRAPDFCKGDYDTAFIDRHLAELGAEPRELDRAAAALGAEKLLAQENERIAASQVGEPDDISSPWAAADAFQLSSERMLALQVIAEGKIVTAQVAYGRAGPRVSIDGQTPAGDAVAVADGNSVYVLRHGRQTKVSLRDLAFDEAGDQDKSGVVRAPMHGKVLDILVEEGARVIRGQRVAIIEAMKMEHTLVAPVDGTVADVAVGRGAQVAEGAKVLRVVPATKVNE
jgi:3-methylcrotonyl-CoA carboxylase alpha subunit